MQVMACRLFDTNADQVNWSIHAAAEDELKH